MGNVPGPFHTPPRTIRRRRMCEKIEKGPCTRYKPTSTFTMLERDECRREWPIRWYPGLARCSRWQEYATALYNEGRPHVCVGVRRGAHYSNLKRHSEARQRHRFRCRGAHRRWTEKATLIHCLKGAFSLLRSRRWRSTSLRGSAPRLRWLCWPTNTRGWRGFVSWRRIARGTPSTRPRLQNRTLGSLFYNSGGRRRPL